MTCTDTAVRGLPAARGSTPPNRGIPPASERAHLASGFGRTLRHERARRGWAQRELAAASGVHRRSIGQLEEGSRRPGRGMTYRLARALRADCDEHSVAALAELCDLARDSLRDYSRRPHRRRDRIATQVRADGIPAGSGDDWPG